MFLKGNLWCICVPWATLPKSCSVLFSNSFSAHGAVVLAGADDDRHRDQGNDRQHRIPHDSLPPAGLLLGVRPAVNRSRILASPPIPVKTGFARCLVPLSRLNTRWENCATWRIAMSSVDLAAGVRRP